MDKIKGIDKINGNLKSEYRNCILLTKIILYERELNGNYNIQRVLHVTGRKTVRRWECKNHRFRMIAIAM